MTRRVIAFRGTCCPRPRGTGISGQSALKSASHRDRLPGVNSMKLPRKPHVEILISASIATGNVRSLPASQFRQERPVQLQKPQKSSVKTSFGLKISRQEATVFNRRICLPKRRVTFLEKLARSGLARGANAGNSFSGASSAAGFPESSTENTVGSPRVAQHKSANHCVERRESGTVVVDRLSRSRNATVRGLQYCSLYRLIIAETKNQDAQDMKRVSCGNPMADMRSRCRVMFENWSCFPRTAYICIQIIE